MGKASVLDNMMEEVSDMMAYDSSAMEKMSEEEILACLVSETGPGLTIPPRKAHQTEIRLQIMVDDEDPLDKYQKENRRLQQASLRLEQENDNLAHRLITSKVALRKALDKAEDRVDELSSDLLQARYRLMATEEMKKSTEEESAMVRAFSSRPQIITGWMQTGERSVLVSQLKEVFRRELEKAEAEASKSSVIVAEYKQICSQLTNRLEKQQTAHKEEVDSLKSTISVCSRCRCAVDSVESATAPEGTAKPSREQRRDQQEKEALKIQIRKLEKGLAQTKLQMVEANCKIQELEHQKGILANDLQEAKNSWISKAFTSLRPSGGGGLHGISMHREGAPTALSWNPHGGSFSGWSIKKMSWPHRDDEDA
ncbi:rab GTPase-activating protein 1-like isoform X1 [Antennarius striatus]|uniref:rab GTPase-activating protein 1-like isoform X1 n=1 Tax=Antennarius striatus TaxID=241820 RepID=UPI0035B06AC1